MPDTKITDELVDWVAAAWVKARESSVEHPTEAHRVAREFLTMLEAVMGPLHEDREDEEVGQPEAEDEAPTADPTTSLPAPEPTPEPSSLPATIEPAPEPTASDK